MLIIFYCKIKCSSHSSHFVALWCWIRKTTVFIKNTTVTERLDNMTRKWKTWHCYKMVNILKKLQVSGKNSLKLALLYEVWNEFQTKWRIKCCHLCCALFFPFIITSFTRDRNCLTTPIFTEANWHYQHAAQ